MDCNGLPIFILICNHVTKHNTVMNSTIINILTLYCIQLHTYVRTTFHSTCGVRFIGKFSHALLRGFHNTMVNVRIK